LIKWRSFNLTGMVDPGENVTVTLKREFFEEALNGLELDKAKRSEMEVKLECFFKSGVEIYRGYVDDPRNTGKLKYKYDW